MGAGLALSATALLGGRPAPSPPPSPASRAALKAQVAVGGGGAHAARRGRWISGPTVVQEVARGSVTPGGLRAALPAAQPHKRSEHEHPALQRASRSTRLRDGAFQARPLRRHSPAVLSSFDGLTQADNEALTGTSSFPPDTVGAVGPHYYLEMTNTSWAVYSKTGTKLAGPFDNQALWAGLPSGLCRSHDDGDPIVVYDPYSDRWVLTQAAWEDPNSYHECVAVSKTSNPAGGYWSYDFLISASRFDDYPKIGVWPDGYYLSFNDFQGDNFAGVTVAAFPRARMVSGLSVSGITFSTSYASGNKDYSMLPADVDGRLPPPAGSPELFAEYGSPGGTLNRITLYALHANWTTPSASTFKEVASLPTATFDDQICSVECIRQRGTSTTIDQLSDRLLQRLAYRNLGSGVQALVLNHTVRGRSDAQGAPSAAVRWYELRKGSGAWSVHQQGTYQPDASAAYPLSRWMGSIAMDGTRDVAIGYSASSRTTYPSIRYAGRVPSDQLGKLEAERTMYAGTGAQLGANRWGDYTAMSVDPVDDCTFWYLGEYYASSGGEWRTRIGTFRFPSCVGISAVSPESATRGTVVTVTGVGFTSGAVVKFGGVSAQTTFVSSHKLTAKVPAGAASGRVSVAQGAKTVYSPAGFTVGG